MGPGEERGLDPQQVSPYSNRAVWWRCGLGHSWHAAISTRAWGSDCPYCAGRKVLAGFNDLATRYPELAQTWDPVLNGALTPAMVTPGSHKKVWWRCPENHVWKAVVYSRTSDKRCGCPVCAGKVSQEESGAVPGSPCSGRGGESAGVNPQRASRGGSRSNATRGGDKNMKKRLLAMLMVLSMALSILPYERDGGAGRW
ncbi:MAG: zinc-ribbon domain-containing protein [Evtepia gabavorous]